jgi:hypothetical protein
MGQTIEYAHKVRLCDALYGTKFVLHRNSSNLEITIPPKIKDGTRVKLTNALNITDNSPGDIIIQIQIEPRPVISLAKGTNIDNIFQYCLYAVGGLDNDHVNGYLSSKNNKISRQLFFEKAVSAIWVAGWGQKQCNTFLSRAVKNGFTWDFSIMGQWSDSQLIQFMQRMHGQLVRPRAVKKWNAVHKVGQWLNSFQGEDDFRRVVFKDVLEAKHLGKNDVSTLRSLKLPFIGEANSFYIIRMLGGEEIKDDVWIKEFRAWASLDLNTLEGLLATHNIPRGFFDIVTWEYCNMFIKKVNALKPHLVSQFGFFVSN